MIDSRNSPGTLTLSHQIRPNIEPKDNQPDTVGKSDTL